MIKYFIQRSKSFVASGGMATVRRQESTRVQSGKYRWRTTPPMTDTVWLSRAAEAITSLFTAQPETHTPIQNVYTTSPHINVENHPKDIDKNQIEAVNQSRQTAAQKRKKPPVTVTGGRQCLLLTGVRTAQLSVAQTQLPGTV